MRAFLSLSLAMTRGLLRDRSAVFFTLIFPLMFLVLFGALFKDSGTEQSSIVQVGKVKVLDNMSEKGRAGLRDVLKIERSDGSAEARDEALEKVRKGDADAAVFERDGKVELRYSAADQVRSGTVRGVMDSVVQQANQRATGQPPAFALKTATLEDRSTKPIQFLTPGLLGWAVAMGGVFGAAFNLVSWRKKRILRRLWLAPISAGSVIGARVGVNLGTAFAQTAIFLSVAMLPYYGLKLTGDWWLCLPLVVCGTLAFMSIGLLVGSWARTEEAANGLAQIIILPMAFLSGSFFPLDNAPGWVRSISEFLPLKHLSRAMEDVLSRGESWGAALPTMGGLLLFAAVLTAIAAKLFRWDSA
ncbi:MULTISPECIES: ABC transporter permease [unclassified Streptomyces]|uniref:ABC transporter permease n=1 Tax=unclassified Streptomyces TaxID=2593676 RepID=UPI002DD7B529|nr:MULTISPECIES: ABC transporter permease [unclassified Streptomyces]WSA94727.1 ABC transporter permease [Streptomyces sp. NBC_01795]WSB79147.1 ABC transporter permease [Streptomyces sp. NBC_01775]WSS12651.1 ABC transporter permease [Streptomyces sp. NBC_01186]WSS41436.1 ABC transporter permease [Streptomyces sp. NBC_01187]